jgi:hypothetical protein
MTISDETEVTAKELAALWSVTRKRVEQLAADGVAVRLAKGRFKLVESNRRFIAQVIERQARKSSASTELHEMRSADLSLRMEERKGALIARAEDAALAAADRVLGEIRTDLYAIPARVTQDHSLRTAIERGLDDAFTAAADRCSKRADGLPVGGAPVAAARSNKPRRLGAKKPRLPRQRRRAGAA